MSPRSLVAALVAAGCVPLATPTDPLLEICAGPVPPQPQLEVLELTPRPGTAVDKQTVVHAKLAYSAPPKWAGDVTVNVWLGSMPAGRWYLPMGPGDFARPELARGTVDLALPLRPHLEGSAEKPLRLRFVLQHLQGRGGTTIAETDLVEYPTPGLSSGVRRPTLTVRSLDPAPEEALGADTTVAALLAYAIPGPAAPGEYEIIAELAGSTPGRTRWLYQSWSRAKLTAAEGLVVLHLPLAQLLRTPQTLRPSKVRFVLMKDEKGARWPQAETAWTSYDLCRALARRDR